MAEQPYIPRADGAFRKFAENFCNNINADPAKYMLTAAEAASLMRKLSVFQAAFGLALNEETRNKRTIANKDDARSILENSIRIYSGFIKLNRGITDGDKFLIGVPPINISRKRRVCPVNAPLLNYIGSLPGIDDLRFGRDDSDSPAKPYGAARLELWVTYSGPGEPTPNVTEAKPIGSYTRSRMLIHQDMEKLALGLRPTYYARWAGYNDNKGPNVSAWSLPVSLAIATEKARKIAEAKRMNDGDSSLKLAA